MNSKIGAFSIALILALVDFGSCLKCYHCDSQKDPKCGTSFTSAVQPLDCESSNATDYRKHNLMSLLPEVFKGTVEGPKYCHTLAFESGTVFRSCLEGNKTNMNATCETILEETKNGTLGTKVKQCFTCDKDGCNGAGSVSVSQSIEDSKPRDHFPSNT